MSMADMSILIFQNKVAGFFKQIAKCHIRVVWEKLAAFSFCQLFSFFGYDMNCEFTAIFDDYTNKKGDFEFAFCY